MTNDFIPLTEAASMTDVGCNTIRYWIDRGYVLGKTFHNRLYVSLTSLRNWLQKYYYNDDYTALEAARLAGVSEPCIRQWIKRGRIHAYTVAHAVFVDKPSFHEHLNFLETNLTVTQAAQVAGVKSHNIYYWMDKGWIDSTQLGGLYFIEPKSLERYLSKREAA